MNNPYRLGTREFEDDPKNQSLPSSRHDYCEALFVKDNVKQYQEYISYCSGVAKLFIRNIEDHRMRMTIDLSFQQVSFPVQHA